MIIEKEILLEGAKGETCLTAMFDSGATYSCILPEYAEKIGNIEKLRKVLKIETASKGHFIEITEAVRLDFYLDNCRFSDEFLVVPNLSEQVIIGATTMQKWRFKLDFENDDVVINKKATKLKLV